MPACLAGLPVMATGRGETLAAAPRLPDLCSVLVNPGTLSPTREVFQTYDRSASVAHADLPLAPAALASSAEAAAFLRTCRNDLEPSAISLQPVIGRVLALLRQLPETLFARMSGSGLRCAFKRLNPIGGCVVAGLAPRLSTGRLRRC